MGVFIITDPIFTITSVEYDPYNAQIVMKADFSADYVDKDLTVEFVPNESVDGRYFASVASSASYLISVKYYSGWMTNVSKAIPYICYAIAVLGLIALIIGLVSKRLAGLEAMFVYQMAWLTMVWLNISTLYAPFKQTYPLGFTTGYHQPFFSSGNQSTRLMLSSSAFYAVPQISMQVNSQKQNDMYPHLSSFSLDEFLFANNFNIFFALQVIPLCLSLIFGLVVKVMQRRLQ